MPGRFRTMAAPTALTAAVTIGVLAATGGFGQAQTPTPLPPPTISATTPPGTVTGRLLYLRDCAWCHGEEGQGTNYGPTLVGVGEASADFVLSTGRMPIPKPEQQPQRREPLYTPEQIDGLVEYVGSFGGGPAVPRIDPLAGNLGEGARLYETDCAACHSSTGIGGALTSGLVAPDVLHASPDEIAEAVRLGGGGLRSGNMPKFGPDVMTDDQLNSVVRYVLYLQHPDDRGGAPLGRIGPVVEGLVAWVGGLLPLVVFIVWIGRRTTSKENQRERVVP